MNDMAEVSESSPWWYHLYTLVKYATYALLSLNIYLFLQQELTSANHSLATEFDIGTIIQLFSATLDTAAWVVLLLLFELETAVIPDEKLVGGTKLLIHGVRLACGAAIVSAFVGYWGEWQVFLAATSIPAPACDLVGQGWSVLLDIDAFVPLDAASCAALGSDALNITSLNQVLATPQAFASAHDLALADVINAAAWILVVVILEIEVRLQLKGGVPRHWQWAMNGTKIALYLTLGAAAVYWGFEGEFLDFWDAFLWLFAFVFIELNVFEWQQELKTRKVGARRQG